MKYFFLFCFVSSIGFLFYKGLKIDPSIVPSNLINKQTPHFQLEKIDKYPLFQPKDLKKQDLHRISPEYLLLMTGFSLQRLQPINNYKQYFIMVK